MALHCFTTIAWPIGDTLYCPGPRNLAGNHLLICIMYSAKQLVIMVLCTACIWKWETKGRMSIQAPLLGMAGMELLQISTYLMNGYGKIARFVCVNLRWKHAQSSKPFIKWKCLLLYMRLRFLDTTVLRYLSAYKLEILCVFMKWADYILVTNDASKA